MPNEAFVRIDQGVKRGPRKQRIGPRLAPLNVVGREYHPTKLQGLDPFAVITRYLNGETSDQIALTLNCTRQGLSYYLRKTAEEDWREAQIVQAIERKDSAEDLLAVAGDPLSLARAREQLRAAQWDLERLFSRLYGPKQEVTHVVQPVLTINTQPAPGRIIDAEIVAETPNGAVLPASTLSKSTE